MIKKIIVGIVIILFALLVYRIYVGNTYYMGSKRLHDRPGSYELVWGDPYDGSSLGYSIFSEIDSLRYVKWNNRIIIVEQNIEKKNRWAIIKPKSDLDTILDNMHDTLIRDLTKYQIDSIIRYLKADTFVVENLKPDIIERCYK